MSQKADAVAFMVIQKFMAQYATARTRRREEIAALRRSTAHNLATVQLLELDGGPCIHCNIEWEMVEIKNQFGTIQYYRPACHCYRVCITCGHVHTEELEIGEMTEYCACCGRNFETGNYWFEDVDEYRPRESMEQRHRRLNRRRVAKKEDAGE